MMTVELKANLNDAISQAVKTKEPLVIVDHGKPVARVLPFDEDHQTMLAAFRGSVVRYDDIIAPTGETWNAGQ